LQCCGGDDPVHPLPASGVAPDKLFVPMMPEGTILTRHEVLMKSGWERMALTIRLFRNLPSYRQWRYWADSAARDQDSLVPRHSRPGRRSCNYVTAQLGVANLALPLRPFAAHARRPPLRAGYCLGGVVRSSVILCFVFALSCGIAGAAETGPAFLNGNDLYVYCTASDPSKRGICLGYVEGMADSAAIRACSATR
jgi:hypothetical protein